jgi:hypothetical protein
VTVGLGIAALIVSIAAAIFAGRAERSSRTSAKESADAGRRARAPELRVELPVFAGPTTTIAIYEITNMGPQDLSALEVSRPIADDRVTYPVAVTGAGDDWQDVARFASIPMGSKARMSLSIAGDVPPELRCRVRAIGENDEWEFVLILPEPRGSQVH